LFKILPQKVICDMQCPIQTSSEQKFLPRNCQTLSPQLPLTGPQLIRWLRIEHLVFSVEVHLVEP